MSETPKPTKIKIKVPGTKPKLTVVASNDAPLPPDVIGVINANFAFTLVGGKSAIIWEKPGGAFAIISKDSFFDLTGAVRLRVGNKEVPAGPVWMRDRRRRSYPEGIDFDPRGTAAGVYNSWRGFAVDGPAPKGASCRLMLAHLQEVICGSDPAPFDYLIGWLAHMVQRPWEKPGVAVVVRGEKGSGKDTLGAMIGPMLRTGGYFMSSTPSHLTGNFNGHLRTAIFLHIEEAFWAGDHKAESVLKSLITAPQLPIESKGYDAVLQRSCLRLFMSSNADWAVPATADERRFFVLDASKHRIGDHPYFKALYAEIENGGAHALFAHLKGIDLKDFEVRDVPTTRALVAQKHAGLKGFDHWWFQQLQEPDDGLGAAKPGWAEGPVSIDTSSLHQAYTDWHMRQRFEGAMQGPPQISRHLKRLLGDPGFAAHKRRITEGAMTGFVRTYDLPPLVDCRAAWEALHGAWDWSR